VRRVISDDPETLDLLDQAMQRPSSIHAGVDIVNASERPQGNSSDRALRKLRTDAPELHADVLAGRLSAHAAMVSTIECLVGSRTGTCSPLTRAAQCHRMMT
jgi:hypothetical protein